MKLWHFLFLFGFPLSWGQDSEVSNTISKANELLNSKETVVSEMEYRKALSENPNRIEALYNLGNNHYREGDFDEAAQRYFETQKKTSSRSERHQAFHNIGNVSMEQKDYGQAVEAYKNALRNNPADEETRYNYALAKKMLKKKNNNKTRIKKIKIRIRIKKIKIKIPKTIKTRTKKIRAIEKTKGTNLMTKGNRTKRATKIREKKAMTLKTIQKIRKTKSLKKNNLPNLNKDNCLHSKSKACWKQ